MSDSNSLFDFYDCNSSNSFLKFEASSPLFELSPPSSNGPQTPPDASFLASNPNSNSLLGSDNTKDKLKMDSPNYNPLLTTASMPIPARNVSSNSNMSNNNNNNNTRMLNDFSDVIFEFENSKSPIFHSSASNEMMTKQQTHQNPMVINYGDNNLYSTGQHSGSFNPNNILMWEINPMMATSAMDQSNSAADMGCDKPFQMDEDDIFQVDKSDLIQGPTLAELNGDNLLVDLINIEDILTDSSQYQHQIVHGGIQNSQLTQLTAVNFQNLQNAINESTSTTQLSPGSNQFHSIAIPQTPHNTPIPSFQTNSGGQIIFYDDPTSSGSPYEVYSPPNTLTISTTLRNVASTPNQLSAFSPGSHSSTSTSSIVLNSSLSPPPSANTPIRARGSRVGRSTGLVQHNPKYSTLKSLLTEKALNNAQNSTTSQLLSQTSALSPSGLPTRRLNMQGGGIVSRLSSSAPTAFGLEQIWARREPRPHLLSTGSLAEGQQGSTSSLSGEILSPENIDYSQDDSDDDSDHYEDFSSEIDSDDEDNKDHFRSLMASDSNNNQKGSYSGKKSRFFWQYNVQAKGPKGQRLVIKTQAADPHHLSEATDPVFSPNCSIRGIKSVQIKHSGKARKGDGNDLQPNAKKLNAIGKELDKLGRIINDMTPVSELPFNVRPKTRKEKNKLASRACRLKKKAQHEANKIKLFGLEHEHKRLINGIATMKQLLAMKCSSSHDKQEEINQRMEQVAAKATAIEIGKCSTDYVNRVLDRSKAGVPNGGLEDF